MLRWSGPSPPVLPLRGDWKGVAPPQPALQMLPPLEARQDRSQPASWTPPCSEMGVAPVPEAPPPAGPRGRLPDPPHGRLPGQRHPRRQQPLGTAPPGCPTTSASPASTQRAASTRPAGAGASPHGFSRGCPSEASPPASSETPFSVAEPLWLGNEDAAAASGSAGEAFSSASAPPPAPSAPPPPPPAAPAILPPSGTLSSVSASRGCPGTGGRFELRPSRASCLCSSGRSGHPPFPWRRDCSPAGCGCSPSACVQDQHSRRVGGVWSVAAPWRLPSLPRLLRPGDEGQRQKAQREEIVACLLWGTNIPRPEMRIFGATSIPLLLACFSDCEERKRLTTRSAIVLAAECRPVGMQSLPHGFGLGCWAQVPGPGPPPSLLMDLGVLLPPTGPGPPFVGQIWCSWSVHGPGPPRAFLCLCSAAAALFNHKKKKKIEIDGSSSEALKGQKRTFQKLFEIV
ncbi:splicing factor, proline- and glutamine-rich-like [Melospiza georgiana]|uniref:splicing factor, proline- and glutamine-rich-like n=1 Tax=Melospiza georgiana TaxID=44398 RepID=UPI0025AD5E05|nr:splicing factor, proline- and glutamine-rich-like [Melospiza georgiana]